MMKLSGFEVRKTVETRANGKIWMIEAINNRSAAVVDPEMEPRRLDHVTPCNVNRWSIDEINYQHFKRSLHLTGGSNNDVQNAEVSEILMDWHRGGVDGTAP